MNKTEVKRFFKTKTLIRKALRIMQDVNEDACFKAWTAITKAKESLEGVLNPRMTRNLERTERRLKSNKENNHG